MSAFLRASLRVLESIPPPGGHRGPGARTAKLPVVPFRSFRGARSLIVARSACQVLYPVVL